MRKEDVLRPHLSAWAALLCVLCFSNFTNAQTGDWPRCVYDRWILKQANGPVVTMELKQEGKRLTGKASYDTGRRGIMRGTVTGSVWAQQAGTKPSNYDRDFLRLEIVWYGAVGIYEGSKGRASTRLSGTTWEKSKPAQTVEWWSDSKFNCFALE